MTFWHFDIPRIQAMQVRTLTTGVSMPNANLPNGVHIVNFTTDNSFTIYILKM